LDSFAQSFAEDPRIALDVLTVRRAASVLDYLSDPFAGFGDLRKSCRMSSKFALDISVRCLAGGLSQTARMLAQLGGRR